MALSWKCHPPISMRELSPTSRRSGCGSLATGGYTDTISMVPAARLRAGGVVWFSVGYITTIANLGRTLLEQRSSCASEWHRITAGAGANGALIRSWSQKGHAQVQHRDSDSDANI